MPAILSIGQTMCKEDGCFKKEIQEKIDRVATGSKRITLHEYFDSSLTVYYRDNCNKVFFLKVKECKEPMYSVSLYEIDTEKELSSVISKYKDMMILESNAEFKSLKYNTLLELERHGVKLKKS